MHIPAVKSSAILVAFCNWECFPRREYVCMYCVLIKTIQDSYGRLSNQWDAGYILVSML